MNYHSLSLGRIVRYISCGVILTDVVILAVVYALTGSRTAVFGTAAAAAATVCWGIALTVVFQKKLSVFNRRDLRHFGRNGRGQPAGKALYGRRDTFSQDCTQTQAALQGHAEAEGAESSEQGRSFSPLYRIFHTRRGLRITNLKMIQETLHDDSLTESEKNEFL